MTDSQHHDDPAEAIRLALAVWNRRARTTAVFHTTPLADRAATAILAAAVVSAGGYQIDGVPTDD